MLTIKTTGVEDFLDGSANIKALIIGGPGAGKTRMSSFWPKPIYLDCENSRGSLVDRKMPYAEIKTSKDMLDALEYLKSLERIPKVQRQFQTVVVDTVDSFQRIVKDEWLAQTGAGTFSGYDAWGYLDTKMALLLTRLLNLDYNVVTLVHYKEKENEGSKEYGLQLQGAIAQQIFNDFGLVGWLGTYWEAGETGREQRRGLTFHPTPDKDFLKDRFHATPKWMPITLTSDTDYTQLFEAFFNRPEFEALTEGEVVGEIPDSEQQQAAAPGPVAPPREGGPLPERAPVELPLDKQTKEQLVETAKKEGVTVRGNTLKSEIITAIQAKRAEAATPAAEPETTPVPEGRGTLQEPVIRTDIPDGSLALNYLDHVHDGEGKCIKNRFGGPCAQLGTTPDAEPASPAPEPETTTSGTEEPAEAQPMTTEQVTEALGAEVISEEKHDAPVTPQPASPPTTAAKPAAPTGPSACADCGADLAPEWSDAAKKQNLRMAFVKYRRYICSTCAAAQS